MFDSVTRGVSGALFTYYFDALCYRAMAYEDRRYPNLCFTVRKYALMLSKDVCKERKDNFPSFSRSCTQLGTFTQNTAPIRASPTSLKLHMCCKASHTPHGLTASTPTCPDADHPTPHRSGGISVIRLQVKSCVNLQYSAHSTA